VMHKDHFLQLISDYCTQQGKQEHGSWLAASSLRVSFASARYPRSLIGPDDIWQTFHQFLRTHSTRISTACLKHHPPIIDLSR
jgi:hypothetical protein